MNVKELMEELAKMPKELPVFVYIKDDICSEVTGVSLATENDGCASSWDPDEGHDDESKPNAVTLSLWYN